ncbi:Transcription termination factor MTERF4, chloroplastic, partial [Linum grandiflorum]
SKLTPPTETFPVPSSSRGVVFPSAAAAALQKMATVLLRAILYAIPRRFHSTAAGPPLSPSSSFTVDYLVKSCGLPLKSALAASAKFHLDADDIEKPDSVLQFLKSHGFTDGHISTLVQKRPSVLHCRIKSNLEPKFEFFNKVGFVGKHLPDLFVTNPLLLKSSLDSYIKPSVEYLLLVLGSSDQIMTTIRRSSWLLSYDLKGNMQPNIEFLIREGVPKDNIVNMVAAHPRLILIKHTRMVQAANYVRKLGLEPKTRMFMHALRSAVSMSEVTIKKKMDVMKSLGWSEGEILSAFKRYPLYLACSEEKMRKAMDFYVNTMKLEPEVIIKYPKFMMHSIEKRMLPRFSVLQILASKKLVSKAKPCWLLTISEEKFVENYVAKFDAQIPGLLETYTGSKKAKKKKKGN